MNSGSQASCILPRQMKRLLFLIGILVCLNSIAQTNAKLLIGKWRLAEVKKDTTGQSEPIINILLYEDDTLESKPPEVPDITLRFEVDGTATMIQNGEVFQVKYVLQKENLTIGNVKYKIGKIAQSELILKDDDEFNSDTLIFKRDN